MSREIKAIDGSTGASDMLRSGARNISVKLKDHGSKLVEVIDDGEGVDESNFAALTLKYHTSKLRQFSDLEDVTTFGFRGEALSSLCALCDVTIATRHKDAEQATLLKFDHHGVITSKVALCQGSRHHGQPAQPVHHLARPAPRVNISCANFNEAGRKQVILNSQGSQAVRERIATVYGAKEAAKLLEIQQCSPTEEILEEFSLTESLVEASGARVEGYISSCAHGSGRSSADRQFVFVNSRPCEMPKLTKLVNSTYHTFNRDQYPFLLINIHLERHSVDVNVTPDKRSVFVHHEKCLLAIVKCSLLAMFRPIAATYERQSLSSSPALSQSSQQSPLSLYLSPRLQNLSPSDKGPLSTPVKRTSSVLGTPTCQIICCSTELQVSSARKQWSFCQAHLYSASPRQAAPSPQLRQVVKVRVYPTHSNLRVPMRKRWKFRWTLELNRYRRGSS
ncbi:hypothetical protein MTO96_021156 [Rhipicephalus appendiculatus]